MNHTDLIKFLSKFETYLHDINPLITPENWEYYKEHGSLPPLPKEEELHAKFLKHGFKKDLILKDINEKKLSKEEAYNLFDLLFTPKELNEIANEQCELNFINEAQLNLAEILLDYLEEKGLDTGYE